MSKRSVLLLVVTVLATAGLASAAPGWRPARPITVIVPWPAGGSTDMTARVLGSQMERFLGQRIVIVNTPGAQGSVGMKEVWDRPRDGYTWGANASTDMVSYPILGRLPQTHRDWHYFYVLWAPNVIAVRTDSRFRSVEDLIAEMRAKPGHVTVASAGVGSSGHLAAETFRLLANVTYRHVAYAGGAPAVVATVAGETEVVMQLSMEVAEMLRARRLRALAVTSKQALEIEGYGTVPPLGRVFPRMPEVGSYFGIVVPRDLPGEIVRTIQEAFVPASKEPAVKRFARDRGVQSVTLFGEAADRATEEQAVRVGCTLREAGLAVKDPSEVGIRCP